MNIRKIMNKSYCATSIFPKCLIWCILPVAFFLSCGKPENAASNKANFQQSDTINPTITYIEGSSKIIDIVILDDYYIVQNEVEAHHKQLAVYDKASLKYLYSFVTKGHGNNEVMALDMLQTPKGDTLEIIDQAKYKIFKYQIGRGKAKLLGVSFLRIPVIGPLQEIYRKNDSVIVFNTLDGTLRSYNTRRSKPICIYNVRDSLGISQDHMDLANFHFVLHGNKLCLGFRRINALVLGNIKNGGQIEISGINRVRKKKSESDKRIYYYYVDMNDNYILAQYMGYTPGFISKVSPFKLFMPKFEIETYTSNLEPYKHLVTDKSILRCKIERHGCSFYSWDVMSTKSNLLRFSSMP